MCNDTEWHEQLLPEKVVGVTQVIASPRLLRKEITYFWVTQKLLSWLDHNFGIKLISSLTFSWALETITATWAPAACQCTGRIWPPTMLYLPQKKTVSRTDSVAQGPNPEIRLLAEMEWSGVTLWEITARKDILCYQLFEKTADTFCFKRITRICTTPFR